LTSTAMRRYRVGRLSKSGSRRASITGVVYCNLSPNPED
jgi:hypothetical protein